MITLFGALIVTTGCAGVVLAVAGWRGVRVSARPGLVIPAGLWWKLALALGTGLIVGALTGWPMAGAAFGSIAFMAPLFFEARESRDRQLAKSDALASWAEMLRDTIASHAGLRQAIVMTAAVAPKEIRSELRRLAARCERTSLLRALRMFAVEIADPVGDLIVASLVIADQHQAKNLTELLTEISDSARQQSSMRRRIETGRARTYSSSKWIVLITMVMAIGLVTFSPRFLEPYDGVGGQIVLAIVGALFAGAIWTLILMSRPQPVPRLLAGIEAEGP